MRRTLKKVIGRDQYKYILGAIGVILVILVGFILVVTRGSKLDIKKAGFNSQYIYVNQQKDFKVEFLNKENKTDPTVSFSSGEKRMNMTLALSGGQQGNVQKSGLKKEYFTKNNNILKLTNISTDTDLTYQVLENGLKEEIILKSAKALAGYTEGDTITYKFDLNFEGIVPQKIADSEDGGIYTTTFLDEKTGEYAFNFVPPYMYDAKGEKSVDVSLTIKRVVDSQTGKEKYQAILSPNTAWVLDAGRQFPITIDPTITISAVYPSTGNAVGGTSVTITGTNFKTITGMLSADTATSALWHFNELSGASAADSSTNSRTGTVTGTSIVDGVFGKARNFSGENDVMALGTSISLTGDYTIETWFKYPLATNSTSVNTLTRGSAADHQVLVYTNRELGVYNNGGGTFVGSGYFVTSLTTGWHHLAAVGSGSTTKFYIDGSLVGTSNYKSSSQISYVGNYQGGTQQFGTIDEFRISSVARSAADILLDADSNAATPTVTFGGTTAASVTVNSTTSITATTPAHSSGAVDVVITNPDTTSTTLTNGFTYVPLSISPSSGSIYGGTTITLTGAGLANTYGSGTDGAITLTSSKNINSDTLSSTRTCADAINYSVSALTTNTATLTSTPAAGCLAIGDKILLVNLQGTSTNYANVGNYEELTIQSITSATVTFTTAKSKYYGNNATDDTNIGTGSTNQRVMIQRIPQYTNVTINNGVTLTANAWDGTRGGFLYFKANETITNNGTISMQGKGYNGSPGIGAWEDGKTGESFVYGQPNGTTNTQGGGGGGQYHYGTTGCGGAGGAGGGYGTAGANGSTGACGRTGGTGGTVYGSENLSKIFLGSGGGGSGDYHGGAGPSTGGPGGGVIILRANSFLGTSGIVNSNGSGGTSGGDGGYGGGSGGSIFLEGNNVTLTSQTVTATGATGGPATVVGGNGGSGGSGRIAIYATTTSGTTAPTAYQDSNKPSVFLGNKQATHVQTFNRTTTGGTVTTDGDYTIHTFTTNGTFTINENANVEILMVGGGGGGGNAQGGGGGAGGLIYRNNFPIDSGSYIITAGTGGTGSNTKGVKGTNGGNSTAFNLTAIGGGGGGSANYPTSSTGSDGGSGGGGSPASANAAGGTGTSGQGYAGGLGYVTGSSWAGGGGGGGAGSIGQDADTNKGGNGGTGYISSISGTSVEYASGGGGGGDNRAGTTAGGSVTGGGGAGGNGVSGQQNGSSGTSNTGSGGGGGAYLGGTFGTGGNGGSGIVIIKYLTQSANSITATTPAHALGYVDVVATDPFGGTQTLTNGFSYINPPNSFWRFDESYGDTTYDATSYSNNGLLGAGTTANKPTRSTTDCISNNCLSFDGTNDFVNVTENTAINDTSKVSISGWFKPTSVTTQALIVKDLSYRLVTDANGYPLCQIHNGTAWQTAATSSTPLMANEWQHVGCTYDGANMRVYINGVETGTQALTENIGSSTGPIYFGKDPANSVSGIDSYTKLMLHADGTNASTTFTDSELTPKAVTRYGDAQISTAQYKYGDASGLFDGSGDGLSIANHSDFNFGNGDFTVDFWIRATAVGQSNDSLIIEKVNNATEASPFAISQSSGTYNLKLYMAVSTPWDLVNAATIGTLTPNTWTHVAIVRSGTNVYAFFNGNLASTSAVGTASLLNAATPVWIGSGNYASCYFTGNLDEFRISKGIARWTANFTPPTVAYSTDTIYGNYSGKADEIKISTMAKTPAQIKNEFNAGTVAQSVSGNPSTSFGGGTGLGQTNASDTLPQPIAYWSFDEGTGTGTAVKDYSGNNNQGTMEASMTETDWVAGKVGKAMDFDGTNDYIVSSSNTNISGDASATIMAWIKPTNLTGTKHVFGIDPVDQAGKCFHVYIDAGKLTAGYCWYGVKLNTSISANNWTHVAIVKTPGTILENTKIYINGVIQTDVSLVGTNITPNITNTIVSMGRFNPLGNNYYAGAVDEMRVYNTALTQKQINELMNIGFRKELKGIVGYYKLDESFGDTIFDQSGNNNNGNLSGTTANCTTTSATCPTWVNKGKIGNALNFDGGDYVELPINNSFNTKEMTISTWLYPTAFDTSYPTIIRKFGTMNQPRYENYHLRISSGANDKKVYFRIGDSTTYSELTSNATLDANTWTYVTATYDLTTMKIYINGKLDNSLSTTISPYTTATNRITVGAYSDLTEPNISYGYKGYIDELKILQYALSQTEIYEQFNLGKKVLMGGGSTTTTQDVNYSNDKTHCPAGETATCRGPVLNLNFDPIPTDTTFDASGNSNHGNMAGTAADCSSANSLCPTWSNKGKFGNSLSFDGSDYVELPYNSSLNLTNMSISTWVYPTAFNTSYPTIIRKYGTTDSGNYENYHLRVSSGENDGLVLFRVGNGTTNQQVVSTSALEVNKWAHIVATYDLTTLKIYINGKLNNSLSTSIVPYTAATTRITLGAYPGVTQPSMLYPYTGSIDDFKMFDYALTPQQVAQIYSGGKPYVKYSFDETGQTVRNTGAPNVLNLGYFSTWDGYLGSGTAVDTSDPTRIEGTTSCKLGNCLSFDGTTDLVDSNDLNIDVNTVALWVKPTTSTEYLLNLDGGTHTLTINSGVVTATGWATPTIYVNGQQTTTITAGQWSHILVTTATAIDANNVTIGQVSSNYLEGYLDEVEFYNYVPTGEQIKSMVNNGSIRFN